MSKAFAIFALFLSMCPALKADRIYILNGNGYNNAGKELIAAMRSTGHYVYNDSVVTNSIPSGFKTRCEDAVNGYDWLCLFTNKNLSTQHAAIKAFIKKGGKVFVQYEVTCCSSSSGAAADLLSAVLGWTVSTNTNPYIASGGKPSWFATGFSCCIDTLFGAAYKGLDGLPTANQFVSTGMMNSASPAISLCRNFGFQFKGSEFTDTSHKGAIVGLGDVNIWYDSYEPHSNGGTMPINQKLVEYFFPGPNTSCYLFPPGCGKLQSQSGFVKSFSLGNDTTLCDGDSLTLKVENSNSSLKWNGQVKQATFTVKDSGLYYAEMQTICGFSSDSIYIRFAQKPKPNLGPDDSICAGRSLLLKIADTAGLSFRWQNGGTGPDFLADKAGLYICKASNQYCSGSDTIRIAIYAQPEFKLGRDTQICSTMPLTLKSTPVLRLLWQNQVFDTAYQVDRSGRFFAEFRHACDTLFDSIQISLEYPPLVKLGKDTQICSGQSVVLKACCTPGLIKWTDGSTDSVYTATKNGIHTLLISNRCGSDSDDIILNVVELPPFPFRHDTLLCLNQTLRVNMWAAGVKYQWQDGSDMPYYEIKSPGLYTVTSSKGACSQTDSIRVVYTDAPCDCILYMPDAFTPGDDGINDAYGPISNCVLGDFSFNIFNRWGEQIFASDPTHKTWDGTYKGQGVQMDVYLYQLSWKDPVNGITRFTAGTFTLLR